jgi:hypothetical protein
MSNDNNKPFNPNAYGGFSVYQPPTGNPLKKAAPSFDGWQIKEIVTGRKVTSKPVQFDDATRMLDTLHTVKGRIYCSLVRA